jgi:hypothetical protein
MHDEWRMGPGRDDRDERERNMPRVRLRLQVFPLIGITTKWDRLLASTRYFNLPMKTHNMKVRRGSANIAPQNDPGHSPGPDRVGEEDVDGVHEGCRKVR